jgi:hypothetical protein
MFSLVSSFNRKQCGDTQPDNYCPNEKISNVPGIVSGVKEAIISWLTWAAVNL